MWKFCCSTRQIWSSEWKMLWVPNFYIMLQEYFYRWVYISRCIYLLYPRNFSPRDKFFSQFQIQVNFKIWLMWICKYAQNVGKYGLNFKCGLKLQGYTVSLLVSLIRKENVIFRWLNSICKWFSRWWLLPKRKRQKLDVFASRHEKSLKNIPWILNGKMSLSSRSRTS